MMIPLRSCNSFITIGRRLITTKTSSASTVVKDLRFLNARFLLLNKQNSSNLCIRKISTSHFLNNNVKEPKEGNENKKVEPTDDCIPAEDKEEVQKLGLVARFKKMYKEYWYVLLPVHLVTSAVWYGGFFYASKSGVDIVGILESYNVSAKLTDPLKDSSMGHLAVAYILYKIATPARYTVTIGGTTISIKYLVKWGYIKPVPSRSELVKMYQKKKEDFQELTERKQSFMSEKSVKKVNEK